MSIATVVAINFNVTMQQGLRPSLFQGLTRDTGYY